MTVYGHINLPITTPVQSLQGCGFVFSAIVYMLIQFSNLKRNCKQNKRETKSDVMEQNDPFEICKKRSVKFLSFFLLSESLIESGKKGVT